MTSVQASGGPGEETASAQAQTCVRSSKGRDVLRPGATDELRRFSLERPGDRRSMSAALLSHIEADGADDVAAADLVGRVHAGDDLAFAELYVRFYRRVHRYLTIALKNRDDADEATQEVFAKILKSIDRYEHRSEPFAHWLFRVVRNHALDHQKRQWRTESIDPHVLATRDGSDPRLAPNVHEERRDIGELIDDLPDAQRRVLVLRYVYDFSIAEVAEALGKTPDGVRHIHMRALKAIGAQLPPKHARRFARLRRETTPVAVFVVSAISALGPLLADGGAPL